MRLILTVIVMFMELMTPTYHEQCVMSVVVLQSTWFLLSTAALLDGPGSITGT